MTGNQDPTDRWLTDQHVNTRDGLNRFLDLDAGLREATLHGEHTNLQGDLGRRLDIETGLGSALSGSPAPEPLSPAPQTESSQPDVVAAIKAIDPAIRMALRGNPVIRAVILSDFFVRALKIAYKVPENGDHDYGKRVLARDLVRARDLDLTHALALSLNLDPVQIDARNLARHLARDLARAVPDDITRNLDLTVDFLPNQALNLARDLAQRVSFAAGRALGIQQVDGLATALLNGALDDFTDADLTRVDLAEADLTGVRWSVSGTRWPLGTDIDALRARSQEVAPGTDVYVITRDGGKEARHHTPV